MTAAIFAGAVVALILIWFFEIALSQREIVPDVDEIPGFVALTAKL